MPKPRPTRKTRPRKWTRLAFIEPDGDVWVLSAGYTRRKALKMISREWPMIAVEVRTIREYPPRGHR